MNQEPKNKDLTKANILIKLWIHKPAISGYHLHGLGVCLNFFWGEWGGYNE